METMYDDDRQKAERLKLNGNDCFKKKLYNKSIYFYTKSIELDPNNSVVWSNRAQAYLKVHKYEKAYIDTCGALERDQQNQKALYRQALALNKIGLRRRAREKIDRCLEIDSKNKEAVELRKQLETVTDTDALDLTFFQKPEELQSKRPLRTKELKPTN